MSAAGAMGVAGFGIVRPVSDVDVEVIPITYPGIHVMEGSPAPYGLPVIPLEITSSGDLIGRPDAAENQLSWYKYCSHERAPGTEPSFESDNLLSYFVTEEKIHKGFDAWYKDLIGETINVEDFPDSEPLDKFSEFPGVGAAFKWRSEGVDPEDTITGIVTKMPADALSFGSRVTEPQKQEWLDTWFPLNPNDDSERFVASCSFCTHFCCVPGFHESELAISSGYGQTIFCTCHLSRYDPFKISMYDRTIFVFPQGEGEGGGGGGGGGH
ncbi:MAG: hypothetical protein R3185_01125 [Candidatus Thermoplasmatota archaeon]|nr:hypothetical protein [Candidatus Thermoplasmatota archaeon]